MKCTVHWKQRMKTPKSDSGRTSHQKQLKITLFVIRKRIWWPQNPLLVLCSGIINHQLFTSRVSQEVIKIPHFKEENIFQKVSEEMDDGPVSRRSICTMNARLGVGLSFMRIWDVTNGPWCSSKWELMLRIIIPIRFALHFDIMENTDISIKLSPFNYSVTP